jgi:hypothetical protein
LTFGFTNPVLAGDGCSGGGFLTDDGPDADAAVFAVVVAARGVAVFSGCVAFRSGVLADSFGAVAVAGLFWGFETVGDFADFVAALFDVLTGASVFGAAALLPVAVLFGASLATVFPFALSFSPPVPFRLSLEALPITADLSVGPPTAIFVFGSSMSTVLSGFSGGAWALPLGVF